MAHRRRTPRACLSAIKFVFLLLAVIPVDGGKSFAADSTTSGEFLTHRQFIDSCQTDLAERLLSEFTPHRTRPIVVVPDTAGDADRSLAKFITTMLSARGLLVRDSADDPTASGNWTLRYTSDDPALKLTEAQQRSFLGKIWVKRTLDVGLRMSVFDDSEGESVWSHGSDQTYHDWIRKSELEKLQEPGLSPRAPKTGWEKARLPLIVGGGLLVAGVLALSL